MQDKVIYEYAVIRLVPKVEREEFLNIGIILFAKHKHYLTLQYQLDEARILSFSKEVDLETIESYLQAWDSICQGKEEAGPIGQLSLPSRFRWLTASKSTIIQCSKTHPGICDDLEKVKDRLFERYVR